MRRLPASVGESRARRSRNPDRAVADALAERIFRLCSGILIGPLCHCRLGKRIVTVAKVAWRQVGFTGTVPQGSPRTAQCYARLFGRQNEEFFT